VSVKESGIRELGKGWAPTLFGYSAQGLCKFGFYEIFKHEYAELIGEVCEEMQRSFITLGAAGYFLFVSHILVSLIELAG